jgi:large subunit ribosomal protein L17
MRHLKSGRKLNRTSSHRKALMKNLVTSLLDYERITTTIAKAKESRRHVDKMITLGKNGSLSARRRALDFIKSRDVVAKLFSTLAERYAQRNGGYTRIYKIGTREGDNAEMAIMELVDTNVKVKAKKKKKEEKEEAKTEKPKKTEKQKEKPKREDKKTAKAKEPRERKRGGKEVKKTTEKRTKKGE